ncbi:hypothetical protein HZA98_01390 [Candidatus Woesearchaeota archaeon]|nr:hypothetical protein [Candidatus Woesearchaeota archaeon]
MGYPAITRMLMEKGVDSVAVPANIRAEVLAETGMLLFKEGRVEESGKAFGLAGNEKELFEAGDYLCRQGRFKDASYFYKWTRDEQRIRACAHECMNAGHYEEAKILFAVLKDQNMLHFLNENFGI